jgi:hypothetical protein
VNIDWVALVYWALTFPAWVVMAAFALNVFAATVNARVDKGDRLFAVMIGGALALLWPLTLPALIVYAALGRTSAVRASELKAREERLARLEREMGVR